MKEILLTPRVRKNKCDIVFVCVCFSLPSLCPVVGTEAVRAPGLPGWLKSGMKRLERRSFCNISVC